MEIHEENAWVKVIDGVIGEIPIVGMFTGYMFNPAYIVSRMDKTPIVRLQKQPALFLLGVLTMTLLERSRG